MFARTLASLSPLVCSTLLLCACGSGDDAPEATDRVDARVGRDDDGGVVDLSIPGDPGYGRTDASADGGEDAGYVRPLPENTGFDTALRIEPDGVPPLQDERTAEQVDYFVFTAKAGAFYEITTDNHRFSPDNVLSVYDDQRVLLGENDDGARWQADSIDTRVIVRAERDGDIFLKVEDPYTSADFFLSNNFQLLYYHPRVREIGADTPGFALESAGKPLEFAIDEDSEFHYVTVVGESGEDEDVFAFHGVPDRVLAARMLGMETASMQTDGTWVSAQLADAAAHVLGQIESKLEQSDLHPPITDADYTLRVQTNSQGTYGPGFYALDIVLIPENPRELSDSANNTPAGADVISFVGTLPRRGLVLSTLPSGDVDHYRFDLADRERVGVVCEAASGGSLLRSLHAEIVDAAGTVLGMADELRNGLSLEPVAPPSAGAYYLRLSASSSVLDTPEAAWARCAVRIGL